ncbi:MAG: aldo/keto reductase [Lachnospiraceae bacterium]|nr:aldo/keto reductase [Lachnospiraceae bacterium]
MKQIKLGGVLPAGAISLGCMRISGLSVTDASKLINTAREEGINLFEHADIYGGGRSEEIFSQAIGMTASVRERIYLQTKCGICPGCYDFSAEHIVSSVEKSLKRLRTDYLDILLLHRPDTLMEPELVAEAFELLHRSGKVRYFGVSNCNPMQIELLQKYLRNPLLIDQLQLSAAHTGMLDAGIYVNTKNQEGVMRDGSILEYCRLKEITIQAWSPFQYGMFEGTFLGNDKFRQLNEKLEQIAVRYGVTSTAAAAAFLLRHPAKIQVIAGTTNPNRLKEICQADTFELTRKEWYEIYCAAGHTLP